MVDGTNEHSLESISAQVAELAALSRSVAEDLRAIRAELGQRATAADAEAQNIRVKYGIDRGGR